MIILAGSSTLQAFIATFPLRISIDLTELAREVSHNIWRQVEEGEGFINLIVTISATDKVEKSQNQFLLGDARKNQLLDKYVITQVKNSNFLIKTCRGYPTQARL